MVAVCVVAVIALTGGGRSHEGKESLVLLKAHCENRTTGLEAVVEGLVEDERRLNLYKRTEFGLVVLEIHTIGDRLFFYESVGPGD